MGLSVGQRLGPYEILAPLGAGGMGEVYRARDARLAREVAIKVLASGLSTGVGRSRFEQEARVAGALNHPNLLAVFDIGEHEGETYVVFELLEGATLRDRLSAGALPVKRAVDYALQIAHGLAAAHDKGIVHRDLKPGNLFVTTAGLVKILDFGLAKLRPELDLVSGPDGTTASVMTDPGTVLGTVGYMSPEQVRAHSLDHRSDIFSFGAVLYEMLSGKQAFRRDSAVETMNAILKEDPPELSRMDSNIPPTLERILARCLEKQPDDRFRSAHDLAFALDSSPGASGGSAASTTPAGAQAAKPWGTGRHWLIATVTTAAVVALGGIIVLLQRRTAPDANGSRREATLAVRVEKLTSRGNTADPAMSPDGRYLAYSSLEDGRGTIWLRDLAEQRETRLVAPWESPYFEDIRFSSDGQSIFYSFVQRGTNESALYRVPLIGGDPRLVSADSSVEELSPDDKHLAQVRRRNGKWTLVIANLENGVEKDIGETTPPHAWSRDGSQLLFGRQKGGKYSLFIVNADGASERKLVDLPLPPSDALWNPDGRRVIVALDIDEKHRRLYDLDPTAATMKPIGDRVWQAIGAWYWLPDGSGLVVNEGARRIGNAIYFVSYPNGGIERIPADTHDYAGLSMSADGTKLVTVQSVERSDLLASGEPERGTFKKITSGTDVQYDFCWTADDKIIYTSNDGGSYDLYKLEADGSNRKQLTFDRASNDYQPAASPDGRYIVFVSDRSGEEGLYRIDYDGGNIRRLTPEPKPGHRDIAPQFTPDSQWVLYRHWDNGPTLWKISIEGGTPLLIKGARPPLPGAPVESAFGAAASPDGSRLAFISFTQDPNSLKFSGMEIVVTSFDGRLVKRFPYFETVTVGDTWRLQWSVDGGALFYNGGSGGPNLWKQLLAGGPPVQIKPFEEPLSRFDWSLDGKRLAVSRSSTLSDVVSITNFH